MYIAVEAGLKLSVQTMYEKRVGEDFNYNENAIAMAKGQLARLNST